MYMEILPQDCIKESLEDYEEFSMHTHPRIHQFIFLQ